MTESRGCALWMYISSKLAWEYIYIGMGLGVLLAGVIVVSVSGGGSDSPLALVGKDFADAAENIGLVVFLITLCIFSKVVLGRKAE